MDIQPRLQHIPQFAFAKSLEIKELTGGMAGNFLKAAAVSTEKAVEMMKLIKRQMEVTMFAPGVGTLEGLKVKRLVFPI